MGALGARRGCAGRAGRAAWACSLGVPVRMVGMLAGSVGPVWVLVNLAQLRLIFDPILTQYCS